MSKVSQATSRRASQSEGTVAGQWAINCVLLFDDKPFSQLPLGGAISEFRLGLWLCLQIFLPEDSSRQRNAVGALAVRGQSQK